MDNPRVLYIGEFHFYVALQSEMAKQIGIQIETAGNAEQALKKISETTYSCILISPNIPPSDAYPKEFQKRRELDCDLNLEYIASEYVLRRIRDANSKNYSTPVLITTSLENSDSSIRRLLKADKKTGKSSYFYLGNGLEMLAEIILHHIREKPSVN